MKNHSRTRLLLTLSVAALFLLGCQQAQTRTNVPVAPGNNSAAAQSESSKFRFQQPGTQGPSAVESAIELSKKYSALIEEMDKLRQENQRLKDENESLKGRVNPCENQLAQAQKELNEANELLIDMRIEMNNWKANVLGFRDEMRRADQAQLEALLKIITVLGGKTSQDQGIADDASAEMSDNSGESEVPLAREDSNG